MFQHVSVNVISLFSCISLYEYTTAYLSIHLLMGICALSRFWQVQTGCYQYS